MIAGEYVIIDLEGTREDGAISWELESGEGYTNDLKHAARHTHYAVKSAPSRYNDGEATAAIPLGVAGIMAELAVPMDRLDEMLRYAPDSFEMEDGS